MNRIYTLIAVVALSLTAAFSLSARGVILGDEQFSSYLPELQGKKVAVFSNKSGVVGDKVLKGKGLPLDGPKKFGPHLVDVLLRKKVNVSVIFSPEHGFRADADAGEHVSSSTDPQTGVEIVSLYGNSGRPSAEDAEKFDVLLVDIQDVGLRFYTYYVTMYRLMDFCADYGRKVIVLDRPNPNGFYVDGPILDMDYKSGVGALPIPVVHGMTLGELALMINGEGWLKDGKKCQLSVVTCRNYTHQTKYQLIMPPSPNLKTMRAVYLDPSTCLFEGTVVSLGRGTDHPFEMYGSPDMKLFSYRFMPKSMPGAKKPDYQDEWCYGVNLSESDVDRICARGIDLNYIINAFSMLTSFPGASTHEGILPDGRHFFGKKPYFDKLMGNSWVRELIMQGLAAEDIKVRWQPDVEKFKAQRRPYLLYEE